MKTNRKSVLVLSALALITTSATVSYGALTGSITISGVVPGATAIVVTPVNGYNTLDLTASPVDKVVANVQEMNNTTLGYKVSLTSSNSGQLSNGKIGSLPYTAKYNSTAVTLSSTPVVVTNAGPSNVLVNVTKAFSISYTGASSAQMMAGTYSDTLTFTIAAN